MNRLLLMLVALTVFTAVSRSTGAEDGSGVATQTAVVHEIQVTARKYEFTPRLLRVKRGEEVRLIIAPLDHDHGFKLDEFHINQTIKEGRRPQLNSGLIKLVLSNVAARTSAA